MRKNLMKKLSSCFLCMMLIMAMAFVTTGCADEGTNGTNETQNEESSNNATDVTVLGEGATVFTFTVVDQGGNQTDFEIHTDETIVGEALLKLELIDGDQGDFGLYVMEVNGITADYNVDGTYWAFYINDEYAMTGVDTTEIEANASYAFKVEK